MPNFSWGGPGVMAGFRRGSDCLLYFYHFTVSSQNGRVHKNGPSEIRRFVENGAGFNLSGRRYPIWNNQDAVYFHGTTKRHADAILREGIDPARGDPNRDFGRGFYTTTNLEQAEEWAEARAAENDDTPVVLKFTVNRAALAQLRNLSFVLPTEDYWSLVKRCRARKDAPYPTGQHYDVINGPVAKRWFGSESFTIHFGYDQTSFHGDTAKAFLNDSKLCRVEVAR